jgi:hypothetical protein|tara:strand:+ start:1771 stop:2298 length:528 start_codon:yes stop_codon:yes gene_type:complete
MQLSAEQIEKVSGWVAAGESIANIQNLLKDKCGLPMTYMDVRFLVDDLGVNYQDSSELAELEKEAAERKAAAAQDEHSNDPSVSAGGKNPAQDESAPESAPSAGSVSIEVDAVIRPGSLVSGTVLFSDGVQLGWQLSSTGQLGLIPGDNTEYRPSNEDLQSFQTQLQGVLEQKGF